MAKALFESKKTVESYKTYRPHYSQQVADYVLDELKKASPSTTVFDLMVEVGCGSGQATNLFAPYFKEVLATDISQEQIKNARQQNKFQHVSYDIGTAEKIKLKDGSVDLLLAAEAAHWFEIDQFLLETSRVLKPQGCLALIGYASPNLISNLEEKDDFSSYASNLFYETIIGMSEELKPEEGEVFKKYSGIHDKIFASNICRYSVYQRYDWNLTTVKGFIRSLGIYGKYIKNKREELQALHGNLQKQDEDSFDPAEVFGKTLKQKLGCQSFSDADVKMKAEFEIFIIVAQSVSGVKYA